MTYLPGTLNLPVSWRQTGGWAVTMGSKLEWTHESWALQWIWPAWPRWCCTGPCWPAWPCWYYIIGQLDLVCAILGPCWPAWPLRGHVPLSVPDVTKQSGCIMERLSRFFVKENCMSWSWNLNQKLGKKSTQGVNIERALVRGLEQWTKARDLTAPSREAVAVSWWWI